MEDFLITVAAALKERLQPAKDTTLAPFATEVVAIDCSNLDKVRRSVPNSVPNQELLPGKLQSIFDVRRQLWHTVELMLRERILYNRAVIGPEGKRGRRCGLNSSVQAAAAQEITHGTQFRRACSPFHRLSHPIPQIIGCSPYDLDAQGSRIPFFWSSMGQCSH